MPATMYPSELLDYDCDRKSKEELLYRAFRDGLTSDYHVFHSMKMRWVDDTSTLREKEIDFLIYHREKGILCLEAKHCNPQNKPEFGFVNGRWQYSNKVAMHFGTDAPSVENGGGGPFAQAKYEQLAVRDGLLKETLRRKCKAENPAANHRAVDEYIEEFFSRFKVCYGVCFHGLTRAEINAKTFPPEASKDLVLALDDFKTGATKDAVDRLFSYALGGCSKVIVDENEDDWLLHKVLCPAFDIKVSKRTGALYDDILYSHLLTEQVAVLRYLDGQRSATINGLAGTGKTFVAMEWARICAKRGEKVLYLCFNSELRDYLEDQYRLDSTDDLVQFRTLAGYLYNDLRIREQDDRERYRIASSRVSDLYGRFPYQHVILDEGQDCALTYIEDSGFVSDLKEVVLGGELEGRRTSFYIFYDEHQLVAGRGDYVRGLPKVISDSDAKLTLYKNCRNTRAIASASTRGVIKRSQRLVVANGLMEGAQPEFYFNMRDKNQVIAEVVRIASECRSTYSPNEIVVISCALRGLGPNGLPADSLVADRLTRRDEQRNRGKLYFNGVYDFSTYRKFKGLDRAVVILVDVSRDAFIGEQGCMPFYEASSRARQRLYVVSTLNSDDCRQILDKFEHDGYIKRDPDCEKAYESELIEDHLGCILKN